MEKEEPKDNDNQISKIMNLINCPHDFQCHKEGIKNFHNFKNIIADDVIECGSKEFPKCPFSLSFGFTRFCNCPLLNYLYKKEQGF